MRLGKNTFENMGYLDRHPEFRKLVAFCESENLIVSYLADIGRVGIGVSTQAGVEIADSSGYTAYYDTGSRGTFLLDKPTWQEGMSELSRRLAELRQKDDINLIDSLGSNLIGGEVEDS